MNKKYEIQCAVRECTARRGRNGSLPIYWFPKKVDAEKWWIEAYVDSYLSRLEYRQVV